MRRKYRNMRMTETYDLGNWHYADASHARLKPTVSLKYTTALLLHRSRSSCNNPYNISYLLNLHENQPIFLRRTECLTHVYPKNARSFFASAPDSGPVGISDAWSSSSVGK
jgi:hypothetical protein